MKNNETLNTWDAENLIDDELTDAELADAQGGHFGGIYVGAPTIITQIQIQVAAGNFGSDILQNANQTAH